MLFKTTLLLIAAFAYTDSARILGVFPMPGISHYILASKLMKGLAEAGHDVTMVSPYPLKDLPENGNFTDIILHGSAEEYQRASKNLNLFETGTQGVMKKMIFMTKIMSTWVNNSMHHPKMKALAASGQKFDAVIMEQFNMEAHKVYSHIFGCPLIILNSVGPNSWVNPTVGNPEPPSYAPHLFAGDFSKDLSFVNRANNLFLYVIEFLLVSFYTMPMQEEIMHAIYPDAPPLLDIYYNVSLVLLNSHTSIYAALPVVPNMIEIGGYFIDPPKKLPQDLQTFLDNATDGAVYFSMGSNLKSKDMPEEKKRVILNVLGKLKEKVIWKFEEDLPGKPPNVMIKKWCPQQDILAHPNVKLFITHGGLLSTTETVYHGVPILAIPVLADQPANAARAVASGYGLMLNYHDPEFSEEKLGSLVNEVLTNPKYKQTVKEKSILYHDRPMSPMKTAVYWVEYVIRHRGAPHLRVAGIRLPWYKYFMVDVIGTIIFSVILVLYVLKLALKRLICWKSSTQITHKLKHH